MASDAKLKKNRNAVSRRFFENYLLAQLAIVSHAFSEDFNDKLSKEGVSRSKWRVLANLFDVEGMYVTELAVDTLLEQPHVTKLTDQLQEEGLVRKIVDVSDRRRVVVQITEKGINTVTPLIRKAQEHEMAMLSSIEPRDARKLKEVLHNLVMQCLEKRGNDWRYGD